MNLYRHNHIFFRIALMVVLLGITCLAVMPGSASLPSAGNDKLNHILAFFCLALLVDYSFPSAKFHYLKILSLIGYGAVIEIVQFLTPSRSCSMYDLLADSLAIFGYIMIRELWHFIIHHIVSPIPEKVGQRKCTERCIEK